MSLVLWLFACGGALPAPEADVAAEAPLEWRSFSPAVFQEAEREGKLVLLDVGIEGCTACRWMLEGTYGDAEVVRRVRANFIPVAVDANANPELGARFLRWAWPATIVLTAEGEQVLAIRGNKRPRNFLPLLAEALERERSGERQRDSPRPLVESGCAPILAQLQEREQPTGGWSRGMFGTSGRLVDVTMGHPTHQNHALRTAEQYAELLDPTWGGLYIARRGDTFIYEKRLPQQAHALLAFAHAFASTGDETWLGHARSVDAYISRFLSDEGGGFYAAQRDVPRRGDMSAETFFGLDDDGRVAAGVPIVDASIYSALNAEAIEAYAELGRLSGDDDYSARARRAAEVLLRRIDDGVVAQWDGPRGDGRLRAGAGGARHIVLETQARAALAFIALYDLDRRERYLDAAAQIAAATEAALTSTDGGYFSAPESPVLRRQRRPLDNALMARALFALMDRTHDASYLPAAEGALAFALRRAGARPSTRLLAALLLASRASGGLIDVAIAGNEGDEGAEALRRAGLSVFSPEARVHFDDARRYPRQEEATAFVCTRDACSPPLRNADALRSALARETHERGCGRTE